MVQLPIVLIIGDTSLKLYNKTDTKELIFILYK